MEDLAKFAVKRALKFGANYAEARIQRDQGGALTLRNGLPDPAQLFGATGIGVRVLVDGALGFASTNDLSKRAISGTVESAYKTAKASRKLLKAPVKLSQESAHEDNWETPAKISPRDIAPEDKLGVLYEIEGRLKPEEVGVSLPSRTLVLFDGISEKIYVNSEGAKIKGKVPRLGLQFLLTATLPGKGIVQRLRTEGGSGGWETLKRWNLVELVTEEAKALGGILREGEEAPKDEVDLVLASEITGIICHESCGHPQEADRILGREAAQAGESYVKPNMVGYNIGSEAVTVVDDPTMPGSYGFYMYDDEGIRARRRVLIKDGVISDFLHNRETAAEFGVLSNAAARAVRYDREPIIRMANTYMAPGEYGEQELIEDIKLGVYIKSFMEWNIDDLRYNQRYVGLEAYLIENGEVKGAVRNPVLEITTPRLYGSVDAVAKDMAFEAATCGKGDPQQGAPVWHGGPAMRLRKIRLGG